MDQNIAKKTYLEFMSSEIDRRNSLLPFITNVSRNYNIKARKIVQMEDKLNALFYNIQVQIDKFTEFEDAVNGTNFSVLQPNRREKSRLADEEEQDRESFAVELGVDGCLRVAYLKDQRVIKIRNHMGDLSELINFCENCNNTSSAKYPQRSQTAWSIFTASHSQFSEFSSHSTRNFKPITFDPSKVDLNLLKSFQELIRFCFNSLGKKGSDCPKLSDHINFFKVSKKDPISIRFKDSQVDYTAEDVLVKLFSSISRTVWKNMGWQTRKVVIAVPSDYGIFEKTDLKRCVEKCDLMLLRVFSLPVAKALVIALRERKESNVNFKYGKHILIDLSSGPLSVTLYETHMYKPVKVISSLNQRNLNSETLLKSFAEMIDMLLPKKVSLVDDFDRLKSFLNDCEDQFKKGILIASIKMNEQETFSINRNDVVKILQSYVDHTLNILNAILNEQNITAKNEIKRIDFSITYFSSIFEGILKNRLKEIIDTKNVIQDQRDLNALASLTKLARKMAIHGTDFLESTLSSNLGTGDYRGIFFKHLKRGTTLPCSKTTTSTTIYDNQESLLIEIYQGERPLTRYCSLLGSLNVNDLPLDKAEHVVIEVTLSIDKDEILTVKAKELKTNKKLSVVIEKGKMNVNLENMVIEAIENKAKDELLVKKLNEIDNMIEAIRKKYQNKSRKIVDKMNEVIDEISEKELTIDVANCDDIINSLKQYL